MPGKMDEEWGSLQQRCCNGYTTEQRGLQPGLVLFRPFRCGDFRLEWRPGSAWSFLETRDEEAQSHSDGFCLVWVVSSWSFYFNSSLKSASEPDGERSSGQKSRRSPLQTLYDGDQTESAVQAIHQGRRELLEEACRSYTRKRRVLIPEDLKHVIVDDQHGLLYCYVPKVACTNWKRVLMVLTGVAGSHTDPLAIPANEAHIPGNLRTLSEYSTTQINQRLRSYLKFVFVREPFERLVSAYRNKFTRSYNTAFHKRYGTKIVRRHRPDPQPEALERGNDVSFEEFVYYLVDPATQREEPFNEHWERVHSLCHPCLIHYDVVGKYETLEQDSRYVLQLAGVEDQVSFPASSKSTRTTGDMAAQFFHNISPFYQKKLYNLYRMDFLLFNYSIPAYLKFR
ncbi:carbohydrate sulfotransferase 11-like protein [Lates japonicus]|uniref:Carbohydrate sulfotransferase n=1 Tax=Lates japonicus TaxID=270547 RepID=A0AAD3MUG0_LATJO|nr:carbohydrate sulfotransferase 11-like protein [Lates japonicus]